MADDCQQPQTGARESIISGNPLDKRPLSKSATMTNIRGPNGSSRKGRFSAIVSTINPLPALGKGFRRRKDSLSHEDTLANTSQKESPKSVTGFTAVASQIEDFDKERSNDNRSRSDTLILLDPDAISESTQSVLRKSSAAHATLSTSSLDSGKVPIHQLSNSTPAGVDRYLNIGSKGGDDGARDSRENTPRSRSDVHERQTHVSSEPRMGRSKSRGQGNRGHFKRREKERRKPTKIDTLLSLEELNLVVAVFMVALSLAEITGKVLSSIGTTIFLAMGLNQWSYVVKLRKRQQQKLRMKQLSKQSSRMRRRNDPLRRKDAAVLDIT